MDGTIFLQQTQSFPLPEDVLTEISVGNTGIASDNFHSERLPLLRVSDIMGDTTGGSDQVHSI
jgi:hypothetical protein